MTRRRRCAERKKLTRACWIWDIFSLDRKKNENGSKPTKKYFFFYKDSPLPFDFQSLIIAQTGKFRKYVRFLSLIRSHRVEKIPKKNNRTCAIIRDSIVPRQTIDSCHSTSCTSKQGHTVDIWDIRQRQQQLVDQLNSLRQPPKEHCKGCLVHRDLQPTRRHPLAYWQYRSTVYSLVPITARWTGSLREGKTSITRCHWWGSNPRPLARQPNALTARPPTLQLFPLFWFELCSSLFFSPPGSNDIAIVNFYADW